MGCLKDGRSPSVLFDLELLVQFNMIESDERVGCIVMFVKGIYVMYICTFY
jgi:hypothetical protein